MSNIEIQRDHEGGLHLLVGGQPAGGSQVLKIDQFNGELAAVVLVPLKHATLSEVKNVVPFVRPVRQ